MDRGTVVPELTRAIGVEGRALLARFSLLKPLVEQMVISEAIAQVEVSQEQLVQARLGLLQRRGFDGMAKWSELLETLGRSEDEVLDLDPQEQRQELSFPVTIQLDDQQLNLKTGSSLPLQVGMSLTANIKLRKVSDLQLLLGELQDKAETLQRL